MTLLQMCNLKTKSMSKKEKNYTSNGHTFFFQFTHLQIISLKAKI